MTSDAERNIYRQKCSEHQDGISGKISGVAEKRRQILKRSIRQRPVYEKIIAVSELVKNVYWRYYAAEKKDIPVDMPDRWVYFTMNKQEYRKQHEQGVPQVTVEIKEIKHRIENCPVRKYES